MTELIIANTPYETQLPARCLGWIRVLALFGAAAGSLPAANNYLVHNLVSDLPGIADHQDKNMVNAWGNAFSGTSPFWIGNNGTGTSTLYDGTGAALALVVAIPGPAGTTSPGAVTGVLFNAYAPAFNVAAGKPASFLFCTENGTISGWNNSADATHAIVMIDNSSSGAIYKGCALGGAAAAPMMYAANFNSGKIDFWDANLKAMPAAFANPAVPAGFAPFNIQNLGGKLYVTYAKQDGQKHDDVSGAGNGYVAVFDMSGSLLANLATQGPLNSPWGLAIAPTSFGDFAGTVLVGNFGDGKINALNAASGALMGALNDTGGKPISIPGLWSINFGNGGRGGDAATLYFTAGISGNNDPVESHGLLGSIQAAPFVQSTGIVNGASFAAGALAANTWVTIKGGALSATTRAWLASDFTNNKLPVQLNGVGVSINGEAGYVEFVSPAQVNLLIPADLPPGPVQIQIANNGLKSALLTASLQATAPAFFTIGTNAASGNAYIAAEHADGSISGPPNLIAGVSTTPFKVGETIVLYATGLDVTNPAAPNGQLLAGALPLAVTPTVTIAGLNAQVTFAGLTGPGLYQLNIVLPTGITPAEAAGNVDVPVSVQAGATKTPGNAVISIAAPPPQ